MDCSTKHDSRSHRLVFQVEGVKDSLSLDLHSQAWTTGQQRARAAQGSILTNMDSSKGKTEWRPSLHCGDCGDFPVQDASCFHFFFF